MIVQITDYGISVLNDNHLPFEIKEYQLGSEYGYEPELNAIGLKGNVARKGTVPQYEAVNGNTVKYRIGLDYDTPSFKFGEIALFDDKEKCVAICVAPELLETVYKQKSIVVDVYLSMVDGNYVMWADDLASSNRFSVPVVETVDALYPVSETTSNLYVVKSNSTNKTSTLAYTTKEGLWNFDVYQYKNTARFNVIDCTPTTITVDVSKFTLEEQQDIIPKYFGEIIVEFASGPLYSVCRNVKTTRLVANQAVLSFATPLARPCWKGDEVMVFGRTVLSVADVVFPPATEDDIGGIKVGQGLSIELDGTLSANVLSVQGHTGEVELEFEDFPFLHKVAKTGNYEDLYNKYTLPVATDKVLGGIKTKELSHIYVGPTGVIDLDYDAVVSVNGEVADPDTGNVVIDIPVVPIGLTDPKEIGEGNLDSFNTAGIFYAQQNNLVTGVPEARNGEYFALEVIPMYVPPVAEGNSNNVTQRITYKDTSYTRIYNISGWTPWVKTITDNVLPIATEKDLGTIRVGEGLTISSDTGILEANVKSVFGKTGDIELNAEDVSALLQYVYNVQGGVPQLSKNPNEPDPDQDKDEREKEDWLYGRINSDQLPLGTLYYYGTWDPVSGYVNGQSNVSLTPEGKIKTITYENTVDEEGNEVVEESIDEKVMSGAVLKVTASSDVELDGITNWATGDLIVSLPLRYTQLNNTWTKLKDNQVLNSVANKLNKVIQNGEFVEGLVYMDGEGKSAAVTAITGGTF